MANSKTIQPRYSYALLKAVPSFCIAFFSIFLIGMMDMTKILWLLGFPLAILYYLYKVLLIRSEKLIISKEQILYEYGLFSVTIEFLEMYRIRDFTIEKPFLLRLIGAMEIIIRSTDKNNPNLILSGIKNSDVVFKIRDLVELQRKNKNVYVTE